MTFRKMLDLPFDALNNAKVTVLFFKQSVVVGSKNFYWIYLVTTFPFVDIFSRLFMLAYIFDEVEVTMIICNVSFLV